jgi:hypothetical protein
MEVGAGAAAFNWPLGVALDANGTVLVADSLGNRLRVLLSYYAEARRLRRRLVVYWVADAHCPGWFDSVFNASALPAEPAPITT